jgi:mannose-6-phosphate isomerase-like protein (cupin superfamily)
MPEELTMAATSPEALRRFVLSAGEKPRSGLTWDIYGDLVTPIITGKESAGGLVILETVTPPRVGPPLHLHHREDEVFYVVEGKFIFEYGGKQMEGGPGTHVFLPRDIPHCFQNIGENTGKMLVICQPAGVDLFFEDLSKLQGPPEPAKVVPVFEKWGLELLGPPMAMR